jgi:hypothetical protein
MVVWQTAGRQQQAQSSSRTVNQGNPAPAAA